MESSSLLGDGKFAVPADLLGLSPAPMVLVNTSTFRLVEINPPAARLLGAEPSELVDEPLNALLAFDFGQQQIDRESGIGHGVGYLWGQNSDLQSVHLDYRRVDGEVPLTLIALFDCSRVSSAVREELEAARTDATTGALRRDSFLQVLNSYAQHPSQSSYGVLFLDIDRFKRFNDEFGHQFGDTVLATVVEVLRCMLRGSDIVGRFGGDEFVVLLSGPLEFGDVERIAGHVERRVASAVSSRIGTDVQASVGAAYCTSITTSAQALRAADAAMYGAKRRKHGDRAVSVLAADHMDPQPPAVEMVVT